MFENIDKSAAFLSSDDVALFHDRASDLLSRLPDNSVDCILTDPPYSETTHKGSRSLLSGGKVEARVFIEPMSFESLCEILRGQMSRVAKSWVVLTLDHRHTAKLEELGLIGQLKFIRFGAWVKVDAVPQISGDRPAQGWESVAILHKAGNGRMRWNGGGLPAVWQCRREKDPKVVYQKPVSLFMDFVRKFSDHGALIVDPFCGTGTTAVAARNCGRFCIAGDNNKKMLSIAQKRIRQEVFPVISGFEKHQQNRFKFGG